MDEFGGYIEDIILAQLTKKYTSFKHVGNRNDTHINITDMKEDSNGIRVYFNVPGNGKRKDKNEFYTYRTLLKCASSMGWNYMCG